jgi:hypothetical protein
MISWRMFSHVTIFNGARGCVIKDYSLWFLLERFPKLFFRIYFSSVIKTLGKWLTF